MPSHAPDRLECYSDLAPVHSPAGKGPPPFAHFVRRALRGFALAHDAAHVPAGGAGGAITFQRPPHRAGCISGHLAEGEARHA